jgi:ribosomal protein L12E/L44/L45/RPP1/RPP2
MKNNISVASKKSIVNNALGSVRVEGLEPSEAMLSLLASYVEGKKTIDELIQETKLRYVALQRR